MDLKEVIYSGNDGIDVSTWWEEIRKISWMREKRRGIFMHMELEACWNETEKLFKCHDFIVDNIPEEHCPRCPYLFLPIASII